MIPLSGSINDPSFIRREIVQSLSWLLAEIVLQIMAGTMTEADAVTMLTGELAFWCKRSGTELEAWQA